MKENKENWIAFFLDRIMLDPWLGHTINSAMYL